MKNVTYLINVSFRGYHDFTLTLDRNGPDNANAGQALFVKLTLENSLGPDYGVSMTRVETTRLCFPK